MFIYGEHTTTAENTKFRPIEKSNNHKGFQDSGNVFMRFSGLHLWLYGEGSFKIAKKRVNSQKNE